MSSWGGPPTCLPNRRPLRPSDFGGIKSPAGRTTSTREGASDGPSGPRRPCADQPIRLPVLPPCPFTRTASPAPTVGSRGISTVNPGASERFLRFPEPPPFSLLSPPAGLSLPSPRKPAGSDTSGRRGDGNASAEIFNDRQRGTTYPLAERRTARRATLEVAARSMVGGMRVKSAQRTGTGTAVERVPMDRSDIP